jgi:hypothetical protein
MGVGRSLMPMTTLLIVHAVAAPLFFALLSWLYHRRFGYTSPPATAIILVLLVVGLDTGLVAPVLEGSFEMSESFLSTWLVFALIFVSSLLFGSILRRSPHQ